MQEENIFELIDGKKYARLRELLSETNPADIAQICEDIPERELPVIFRIEETKKLPKKADRISVRKKRIAFGVETFKMVLQQYPMINMGLGLLTNPR